MDKTKEEQIQDILNDEVDIEGAEETEKTEGESTSDSYHLHSGNALNSDDIYDITAKEKNKMVVLAGLAGSGKQQLKLVFIKCFKEILWQIFSLQVQNDTGI